MMSDGVQNDDKLMKIMRVYENYAQKSDCSACKSIWYMLQKNKILAQLNMKINKGIGFTDEAFELYGKLNANIRCCGCKNKDIKPSPNGIAIPYPS